MLYNEKKIGKKAWLLNGTVFNGLHLDDKTEYISCSERVQRKERLCEQLSPDKDGKLTEVKEYNVVVRSTENLRNIFPDNDSMRMQVRKVTET